MSEPIYPADALAAALMFVARNPEIAAAVTVRAEPTGAAGELADLEIPPPRHAEPEPLQAFNCLDLIALLNRRRMTMATRESNPAISATLATLIPQDPRRIRYELMLSLNVLANNFTTRIGSRAQVQAGNGMLVTLTTTAPQFYLVRDFVSSGDTICDEITGVSTGGNVVVSVRETFLTPLPIDKSSCPLCAAGASASDDRNGDKSAR